MSIRVAVLGCGRIGHIHAASVALSDRAELAAVADAVPSAAEALAVKFGTKVASIEEIMAGSDIDAVIVGTPTDMHADLIERSVERGIAVLCEKPVDLSADRIRACIAATKSSTIPIMIGFNRRFDPHFAELKSRLGVGEIGKLEILTILSRDPAPPPISYIERSGGIFRDMMIHDLDMTRFLLDEDPIEVYATGSVLFDSAIGTVGDVDTAAVILKTSSGRIAQISCSRHAAYGFDNRIEVHGKKGMLSVGNTSVSNVVSATAAGFAHPRTLDFFPERYKASYITEFETFLDVLEGKNRRFPSLHDGLAAQVLADAATRSCQMGMAVPIAY